MNLTSQCSSGRYIMLCGRAPGENQSPFLLGIFTSISELDGRGPPACSPAFSLQVLGKTEGSLPVKLELSFGAPIPSTADSDGGQRKRRERESPQWALATRRCRPGESTSDTPQPAPPHSARGCREDARPGTKCSAAAPPSGSRRQTPGLFRRGGPSVPDLAPPWGREAKARGKPLSDSLFGF